MLEARERMGEERMRGRGEGRAEGNREGGANILSTFLRKVLTHESQLLRVKQQTKGAPAYFKFRGRR